MPESLDIEYLIRPYSVYRNTAFEEIFDANHIEEPTETDIWDSLANAGIVISLYSTVLYQAYLEGIPIMTDDVSNPELFNSLTERDYIMLYKPHKILSESIRKV